MKREKSCGTIIFDKDKVLLIKQNNGSWGFPKGHTEENETEIETALRETKEETNLDVEIISEKSFSVGYYVKEDVYKDVIYFIARPKNSKLIARESEIEELKWVSTEDALKIISHDDVRDLLKLALNEKKGF